MPTNESLLNYVDSVRGLLKRWGIRETFAIHSYDSGLEFFMFADIKDQVFIVPESLLRDSRIYNRFGMKGRLIDDERAHIDRYLIHLTEPNNPQLVPFFDRIDEFCQSHLESDNMLPQA